MAKIVVRWSIEQAVNMIVRILQNKFDNFIVIEGNRGLGKSTLAIHIARRVARKFKDLGTDDYKWHWKNSLIYTKKETKQFWHKWRCIGIADEMINVTFNRDFYNEEQKDIIKMINMNRDHCNMFIACVPQFQTLDAQIKNLCKIRITVVRRGLAVIQTPNRTIYIKDKWDTQTNEKLERGWLQKGIKNPHYASLTTFRGLLKFPALHPSAEKKYQDIKDMKRNLVAKEEMGLDEETKEENDPAKKFIKLLTEGRIRNGVYVDGWANANDIKVEALRSKVVKILKAKGIDHKVANYYWDNKAKEKQSGTI